VARQKSGGYRDNRRNTSSIDETRTGGIPHEHRACGKSFELQVMGAFEVRDGKINAWRDYFDQNRFTSRVG